MNALIAPIATGVVQCDTCPVGGKAACVPTEFCTFIPREYETGATLATAGDAADYLWFVKSGAVGATWGSGREVHVLYPPGSIVGIEALVSGSRLTTAWTLSRSQLCGVERGAFLRWLETRRELFETLRESAAEIAAGAKAV